MMGNCDIVAGPITQHVMPKSGRRGHICNNAFRPASSID